jgi:hypothetical protein
MYEAVCGCVWCLFGWLCVECEAVCGGCLWWLCGGCAWLSVVAV